MLRRIFLIMLRNIPVLRPSFHSSNCYLIHIPSHRTAISTQRVCSFDGNISGGSLMSQSFGIDDTAEVRIFEAVENERGYGKVLWT